MADNQEQARDFTKKLAEDQEIDLATKVNMVVGLSDVNWEGEVQKIALMQHVGMRAANPIEDLALFILRCVRPDFFEVEENTTDATNS